MGLLSDTQSHAQVHDDAEVDSRARMQHLGTYSQAGWVGISGKTEQRVRGPARREVGGELRASAFASGTGPAQSVLGRQTLSCAQKRQQRSIDSKVVELSRSWRIRSQLESSLRGVHLPFQLSD